MPPDEEPMDVEGLDEVRFYPHLTFRDSLVISPLQVELVPLDPDTERTRRKYMVCSDLLQLRRYETWCHARYHHSNNNGSHYVLVLRSTDIMQWSRKQFRIEGGADENLTESMFIVTAESTVGGSVDQLWLLV